MRDRFLDSALFASHAYEYEYGQSTSLIRIILVVAFVSYRRNAASLHFTSLRHSVMVVLVVCLNLDVYECTAADDLLSIIHCRCE